MSDLSYFLGATLTIEDRRKHEKGLIETHIKDLGSKDPLTQEQILEGIKNKVSSVS
jgi:hypothetical protein